MLLSTNDKTASLLQLSRIEFPSFFPNSQNIPCPFDLLVSSMKFLALQNTNVFQAHHRPGADKSERCETQTSANGYKYICKHL